MKQVFLSGNGGIEVLDVPIPGRMAKSILVRNAFSLISSGTEGSAISRHRGLVGIYEKATASRDRVEQVWSMVRNQGPRHTWEAVRTKLTGLTPLGYSSAGTVVEVDGDDLPCRPGDLVACIGAGFANHAEYVVVPANLAAPIPAGAPLDQAAFAAVACIALQGIRRLELTPGERVGVIGLGLVGQTCVRLLQALGYEVFGTDPKRERIDKAGEVADTRTWDSSAEDGVALVMRQTDGVGLDGVVVCAGTRSDGPVNLAFDLCRRLGRVSVVGDVGLGLDRAKMYRKELELRVSCSYGPGRYDYRYELEGEDYDTSHVRWTEGRNLSYFLRLLATDRLNLSPIASRRFPVAEADGAYAAVKGGGPDVLGVLLAYGDSREAPIASVETQRTIRPVSWPVRSSATKFGIGLIGVGNYAKVVHLANLARLKDRAAVVGLASRTGASAAVAAKRLRGATVTSDYHQLLSDPAVDAVIVATRHASHARIALDALDAGKHVYVEKPMTISVEDGKALCEKAEASGLVLRVGFNRRFAPYMQALRDAIAGSATMLNIRVNLGQLANDWSNTDEEGGRWLGEGVHFLDLCNWLIGEEPDSIHATMTGPADATHANVAAMAYYPNGSTAQLLYTTLGHRALGKERIEAFANGVAASCDDFKKLTVAGRSVRAPRQGRNDKGQLGALAEFIDAVRGVPHRPVGANARAGLLATWMALAAVESARSGHTVMRCASLDVPCSGGEAVDGSSFAHS